MKDSIEYRQLMLVVNSHQLRGYGIEKIAEVIRGYAEKDTHEARIAFLEEFLAELERRIKK